MPLNFRDFYMCVRTAGLAMYMYMYMHVKYNARVDLSVCMHVNVCDFSMHVDVHVDGLPAHELLCIDSRFPVQTHFNVPATDHRGRLPDTLYLPPNHKLPSPALCHIFDVDRVVCLGTTQRVAPVTTEALIWISQLAITLMGSWVDKGYLIKDAHGDCCMGDPAAWWRKEGKREREE